MIPIIISCGLLIPSKMHKIKDSTIAILMLLYAFWWLGAFLFNYSKISLGIFYYPSLYVNAASFFLKFFAASMGSVYLILAINMLRNKHWSKIIAKYFSIAISLFTLYIITDCVINGLKGYRFASNISKTISIPLLPALILCLLFITQLLCINQAKKCK